MCKTESRKYFKESPITKPALTGLLRAPLRAHSDVTLSYLPRSISPPPRWVASSTRMPLVSSPVNYATEQQREMRSRSRIFLLPQFLLFRCSLSAQKPVSAAAWNEPFSSTALPQSSCATAQHRLLLTSLTFIAEI